MSTHNLDCWLGRTAYQVIPDRFCKLNENLKAISGRTIDRWGDHPYWKPGIDGIYRNDHFYCGNIRGITSKLGYLKNLGFDMIYLTPIEESNSYHHYDPGNHREIDQWLGTWDDFKQMCNEAHKLGILVVVDMVCNHTGVKSIYYNNPKYSHWYNRDKDGKITFWWGFKDLAECNTLEKSFQDEMSSVIELYLSKGADGIRFDLGEKLPKEFLVSVSKVKEKYAETIFIGEMWNIATDKSFEDAKILDGQLDSVMNYPLTDAILRWVRWGFAEHFKYNYNRVYREYPAQVRNLLFNNIGTHDTPTTITMLAGDKMNEDVFNGFIWDIEKPWRTEAGFDTYGFRKFEFEHDKMPQPEYSEAKQLAKIAIAILYTIPGIPCLFQGTEIAETGYKDPHNRKSYNWNNNEEEFKHFVAEMGAYRKNNCDILAEGKDEIVRIDNNILIIKRYVDYYGEIYMVVNKSNNSERIYLPNNGQLATIFATQNTNTNVIQGKGILIARNESIM